MRRVSTPGRHWHYYLLAVAVTVGLLLTMLALGLAIEWLSGGSFRLFGHDVPPVDSGTGEPLYRPGSLLLAYYVLAFAMLLVHYLHDGFFFFRTRLVVDR